MKKSFLLILTIAFFGVAVHCQEMPQDVPETSEAYEAIYDLVERGVNVSQGYPDGTFYGDKFTTKYDITYLMASLALSLKKDLSGQIDASDIKEEIDWLKKEIEELKQQPGIKKDLNYYGSVELNSRLGNVVAYDPRVRGGIGPETFYRLKYTLEKTMGKDANLIMNLDTMDGGFNSPTARTFPEKIIDVEGNVITAVGLENPLKIQVAIGPGTVYHRDTSSVAPSEDYVAFSRPRPSIKVSTAMAGNNVSAAYLARGLSPSGSVATNEVNFSLGRKMGEFPLIGSVEAASTTRWMSARFSSNKALPNDVFEEISLALSQGKNTLQKLILGMSAAKDEGSRYFFNLELYFKKLNESGTDLNFMFNSVGRDYRYPFEELEFVPLNLFNKKILDGTVDIGLEIVQPISNSTTLKSRSDWVGDSRLKMGKDIPGSSFTQEISMDHKIYEDFFLNAFYRYYHVPSMITQYAVPVSEFSDLIGLGLTYNF